MWVRAKRSAATIAGLGVVGACVALRVRAVIAHGPTDFDDAYMFLRYAHNVLAGHGVAWNPGEPPVQGVTSPLHLAVVTLLRAIAPAAEPGRVLQVASCGAGLAAVGLLAVVCARFTRLPVVAWGAALFVLVTTSEAFGFHARSGMDTMLALLANAAVAGAALWLAERPGRRRAVGAAVIGYLAFLARPENAVAAVSCPVLAVLVAGGGPTAPGRARALAVFVAGFAALVGVDLVLRKLVFGTALPLAFFAKQPGAYGGFAGEYGWNPFWFLRVFFAAALPFVAVLLVLVGRGRWRVAVALLAPVVPTIAFFFSVNQIMGHLGRFYFPMLAFVVVAAALTFAQAWEAGRGGEQPGSLASLAPGWRLAAAALVLAVGGPALEAAGRRYEARGRSQRLADVAQGSGAPLAQLDSWAASRAIGQLARQAPAGTVLAMSEHGLVGALASAAIIVDVLGLHDRTFALQGFTVAELWRRRPDVLWLPHPDHTAMLREILDSEELAQGYDFYPEAFSYGLALRRQSPHFPALHALVARLWPEHHPGTRAEDHLLEPIF